MSNYIIRKATKKDINSVYEIEKQGSNSWKRAYFEDELNIDFSYFLVAEIEDKTVGFIVVWMTIERLELNNISVHPKYKKQGIATTLLNQILEMCKSNEPKEIILEVKEQNIVAKKFYENFGFTQIGFRKNYYGDDNAIVMQMEIRK